MTDSWTSKGTQSYNTVTMHFINEKWEMESAVMDTSLFPGSHTGERIAVNICESIVHVGLEPSKIVAVVNNEL